MIWNSRSEHVGRHRCRRSLSTIESQIEPVTSSDSSSAADRQTVSLRQHPQPFDVAANEARLTVAGRRRRDSSRVDAISICVWGRRGEASPVCCSRVEHSSSLDRATRCQEYLASGSMMLQ